jgi:glycosyltransferase involved in cell wall biosynthesis
MKVLVSCLSKSWGGMEMYTLTSLRQLLQNKVYVELLCVEGSRLHIEANGLGLIINTVKSAGYLLPTAVYKIYSIVKRGNFDIIHSHYSRDLWQIVPALELSNNNTPLILTKHLGSFINKKDRLHQWIYSRLNAAIAISTVIKHNLINTCPISEDKVFIIPDGIDTERFSPDPVKRKKARNEFNAGENDIIIGMIARFSPGKGHEEFLAAAAGLNKKYSNLKFVVVGEASRGEIEYEERIRNLAVQFNLENIIFTGYRSDTEITLNGMDIFAFPSHAEAFGMALVEAMSSGLPSVCSNSDGVLDIAVDGVTSYLFKVKDPSDLQAKLELLIKSPPDRKNFGEASIQRAKEFFNIDVISGKTLLFYEKIISQCG